MILNPINWQRREFRWRGASRSVSRMATTGPISNTQCCASLGALFLLKFVSFAFVFELRLICKCQFTKEFWSSQIYPKNENHTISKASIFGISYHHEALHNLYVWTLGQLFSTIRISRIGKRIFGITYPVQIRSSKLRYQTQKNIWNLLSILNQTVEYQSEQKFSSSANHIVNNHLFNSNGTVRISYSMQIRLLRIIYSTQVEQSGYLIRYKADY